MTQPDNGVLTSIYRLCGAVPLRPMAIYNSRFLLSELTLALLLTGKYGAELYRSNPTLSAMHSYLQTTINSRKLSEMASRQMTEVEMMDWVYKLQGIEFNSIKHLLQDFFEFSNEPKYTRGLKRFIDSPYLIKLFLVVRLGAKVENVSLETLMAMHARFQTINENELAFYKRLSEKKLDPELVNAFVIYYRQTKHLGVSDMSAEMLQVATSMPSSSIVLKPAKVMLDPTSRLKYVLGCNTPLRLNEDEFVILHES